MKNRLIPIEGKRIMEPFKTNSNIIIRYGIFKRTKSLPLFHPYFINYMGNKVHYYTVLNTLSIYYLISLSRLSLFYYVIRFFNESTSS